MIRFITIALLVLPIGGAAADTNLTSTTRGVAQFVAAYEAWDGEGFREAAATLAAGPPSVSNLYWRGTAQFHRLLFLLGEPENRANRRLAAEILSATLATLQHAIRLDPHQGECRALLSVTYGLSIGAKPARALWLGARLMDQEKQARRLTPDNPRVLYLLGLNRYYGPTLLGGKREALELLLAAETGFTAEAGQPAGPLEPRWGHGACLVYAGRTYAALGKTAKAKEYYRKALELNPHDKLAQQELERDRE